MTINKILVPVDFSERSRLGLEHADAVAQRFGSSLVLLHVVPPAPREYAVIDEGFAFPGSGQPLEQLISKIEQRMTALLEAVRPRADVEKLIVHGDPAGEIVAAANGVEVDLVAMPTHGYGVFRRFALGSVTTKVLHDTETPVLTGVHVPELTPIDPEPYKRIACAIDLDSHGEDTLWWAAQFSKACADDLIVIHAAPAIAPVAIYGEWVPPDTRTQIMTRAGEEIRRMLDRVGCQAQVVIDAAGPLDLIPTAAKENFADLLVIGRSHHKGLFPGLRAHASAIIRDAPCPVISI
jgi:nucleotide-binding universal stress UspA family protein